MAANLALALAPDSRSARSAHLRSPSIAGRIPQVAPLPATQDDRSRNDTIQYPLDDGWTKLPKGIAIGSLLAVHALFQRSPFFNRVLASAPSLWWDNRAALCAAQNLQRTGVALPARLFLSVGEEDTPSMTGDLELLEQQLAALPFPQLEVVSRRFAGRDHYNVLPEAFRAGLAALFGAGL